MDEQVIHGKVTDGHVRDKSGTKNGKCGGRLIKAGEGTLAQGHVVPMAPRKPAKSRPRQRIPLHVECYVWSRASHKEDSKSTRNTP